MSLNAGVVLARKVSGAISPGREAEERESGVTPPEKLFNNALVAL